MPYAHISFVVEDGVAQLAMLRSDRLNALSPDLMREMTAAISEARESSSVRALVLSGSGAGFCAGADLLEVDSGVGDLGERVRRSMSEFFNPLAAALVNLPKPLVAAVNGVAAGGGVGLALAADVTLAAEDAVFHFPFLPRLGLVPDMGVLWLVADRVGAAQARSLCLLGEPLTAQAALGMGLVQGLSPANELMASAISKASRLAKLDPHALAAFRRLSEGLGGRTFEDQLRLELTLQADLASAPAFAAGLAAFRERRTARGDA